MLTQNWCKSTRCESQHCVEVARDTDARVDVVRVVHVRDAKDINGPVLNFASDAWSTFIEDISTR